MPLDPRDSFRHFPEWVQPILTVISGKPLAHSKPKLEITPIGAIAIDYTKYVVGVGLAALLFHLQGWAMLALPIAWVLTVNAARSLTSDAHYAGHGSVTSNKAIDKIIGDLLSLSVLAPNMDDYALPHNRGHHGRFGIGSLEDPDIALMRIMGFEMGRELSYYPLRHMLAIISPRFHIHYTILRLRSTFITAPYWRMALAAFAFGGLAIASYMGGWWEMLLVAWLIPILPLYALSALLQFPSEHMWMAARQDNERNRDYLLRVSHGRFFLLPAAHSFKGWMSWSIAMLPLLFQRFFVCVSVLPTHDYHHRHAGSMRWPMEAWLRQQEIDEGKCYTDFYGLKDPTQAQFRIWSDCPSDIMPRPNTFMSFLSDFFRMPSSKDKINAEQ
ncbi:MAG: fatty acid desaturase [Cohaesibacter sp.]|nr:fatty acid desaturase [Cohaesibacter sp.]